MWTHRVEPSTTATGAWAATQSLRVSCVFFREDKVREPRMIASRTPFSGISRSLRYM